MADKSNYGMSKEDMGRGYTKADRKEEMAKTLKHVSRDTVHPFVRKMNRPFEKMERTFKKNMERAVDRHIEGVKKRKKARRSKP